MRQRTVGKWMAAGVAAISLVMIGGDRLTLNADDKPAEKGETSVGVAEARALVKSLEASVRTAQADLGKAKGLLAKLEEKDNTASLDGVWRIAGINGNRNGGNFEKPPYDEYKIMSAGHYLWLSFDPESGAIKRSGGGSYSLKGGVYTARVDYSMAQDLRGVAGQEYKGTCRLEGKKLYHDGNMPNGAVFDELWERVH